MYILLYISFRWISMKLSYFGAWSRAVRRTITFPFSKNILIFIDRFSFFFRYKDTTVIVTSELLYTTIQRHCGFLMLLNLVNDFVNNIHKITMSAQLQEPSFFSCINIKQMKCYFGWWMDQITEERKYTNQNNCKDFWSIPVHSATGIVIKLCIEDRKLINTVP